MLTSAKKTHYTHSTTSLQVGPSFCWFIVIHLSLSLSLVFTTLPPASLTLFCYIAIKPTVILFTQRLLAIRILFYCRYKSHLVLAPMGATMFSHVKSNVQLLPTLFTIQPTGVCFRPVFCIYSLPTLLVAHLYAN